MSSGYKQHGSGTVTPSGTSTPKETVDIYRTLANQISKPIQPLIASSSTASSSSVPDLLNLSRLAYTSKVQNKALNFNPGSTINTDEAKAVKGRKRHRGDPDASESARRKAEEEQESRRKLGIPNRTKRKRAVIDAGAELSYERLRPLHHLHIIYITNLLALPFKPDVPIPNTDIPIPSSDSLHSKLSKADFTGAELHVTSSRNASLVGIAGVVIEETASTFRLLTSKSTVKVIPKNGTQFDITFPAYASPPPPTPNQTHDWAGVDNGGGSGYQSTIIPIAPDVMEHYLSTTPRISVPLLGTNFGFRSGDRAGRKFRPTQGGGGGSGWGEEWLKGEWNDVLGLLDEQPPEPAGPKAGRGASWGPGGKAVKRKRGKSRRKDPPAFGALEVS